MDYLVQFQINVFAMMILIVLYIIIKKKSKVKSFGKRLLKIVMIATAIAIIVEPLTWIFDGMQFFGAFFLEYSTNFVLFLIGPVLGGLMLSYVDYHIFKDPKRIYKKGFYQYLSIFTFFLLIFNLFYPIYFEIHPVRNSFSSGDFKELHYLVLASLYIYMIFFVIKNKNKLQLYVLTIFLVFFMLPIIGMIVQLFDSKLHFSWTSIVLGILVTYIFLESTSTEEDFLTKLYNRQSYDLYLQHLLESETPFGIILIDLNDFKIINDTYGHHQGDQMLIAFAKTLKKVFPKKALVSRLGGDEFIVVIESKETNVDHYIAKINHILEKNEDELIRKMTFSYGYQPYTERMTVDELYTTVDKKMYQYKKSARTV